MATDIPTPNELNAAVYGYGEASETSEEVARRMLADHVIPAASVICDMVTGKDVDRQRYDAAKYVLERALGRSTKDGGKGAWNETFAKLGAEE